MADSEVEDAFPLPYNPSEWIGCGTILPVSAALLPQGLVDHFATCEQMPDDVKAVFPADSLTVHELMHFDKLPPQAFDLPGLRARTMFKETLPNVDGACLLTQKLPTLKCSQDLDKVFRQAILDGCNSVEDPRYPGSFLPLWSVCFWRKMWMVAQAKESWCAAAEWLRAQAAKAQNSIDVQQSIREAQELMRGLRWNEETTIPGANRNTTNDFAVFLATSSKMRSTDIDMMFAHLSDRMENEDEAADVMLSIETLRLWNTLDKATSQKAYQGNAGPSSRTFMGQLERRAKDGELDFIVFPVYMKKQQHWVTMKVDFERKELLYGDSLKHRDMPAPTQEIQKVLWWLKARFSKSFKDVGDQLVHGNQEDVTDCGILCANTAACEVFREEALWTPQRKVFERVNWFNTLVKKHIDEVNENATIQSYRLHAATSVPVPPDTIRNAMSLSNILNEACAMDDVVMADLNVKPDVMTPSQPPLEPQPSAFTAQPSAFTVLMSGSKKRSLSSATAATAVPDPKKKKESSRASGSGNSRAAIWERIQNAKYRSGQFEVDPARLSGFAAKISQLASTGKDKGKVIDAMTVYHPKCDKEHIMKYPYSTRNFETHIRKCKGPPRSQKHSAAVGDNQQITNFFGSNPTLSDASLEDKDLRNLNMPPCPGLDEEQHSMVAAYLDRSGALGGGASSITSIAWDRYGKPYSKLSNTRKKLVRNAQVHEWAWRNHHDLGKVYSTSCTRSAAPRFGSSARSSDDDQPLPCNQCRSLLSNKAFKTICRIPRPPDENYKFIPDEFRAKRLTAIYARCLGLRAIIENTESQQTPLTRYVQGILAGEYRNDSDNIFVSLIEAMALKADKKRRGVGMQNMTYAPALEELAHIICTHSPRAYRALKGVLPLPSERTVQAQRARQPRFPIGIQPRTFKIVRDTLDKLGYDGPVALSCDDTKLLASFRPYYDEDLKGYYVLGNTGAPLHIPDPEAFEQIINDSHAEKATKLRLFCLQIPVLRIPTIVVAALGIPETMSASDLIDSLWEVISGLLDQKIKVASYATDGSTVERACQSLLEKKADRREVMVIKHPGEKGKVNDIEVPILYFRDNPICILQDAKHLLKTFRNNASTGGRVLTLPNHVILYSHIRDIAHAADSPMYARDVDNADRQDDNAATRLFCGATLDWVSKHHADRRGLIAFLFICGELIDAYESRTLSISERVKMVLRAWYFFELWEKFLDVSGYPRTRHYVSPQCRDILRTAITGFLQLVYVYRDVFNRAPLLAWLLLTEMVEHIFGICRQIVKDFTLLDFYLMLPKLFISLREKFFSARTSDGKARASGYNHTLVDVSDVDLAALSTYPSDAQIDAISGVAYAEAHSLFVYLGVTAAQLYKSGGAADLNLPSMTQMFPDSDYNSETTPDADTLSDGHDDSTDAADYQTALNRLENVHLPMERDEAEVAALRYAAIALSVDESMNIASLPELDSEAMAASYADQAIIISETLRPGRHSNPVIAPIQSGHEVNPFLIDNPSNIDLSGLVTLRFEHQTKQAQTGVKTSAYVPNEKSAALTERQRILRGFNEVIRRVGDKGVSAGAGRQLRWTGTSTTVAPSVGNSANAADASKKAASTALKRRCELYKGAKLLDVLGNGGITTLIPLHVTDVANPKPGGYAFCFSSDKRLGLVLCKVICIYSKGGGKHGKHSLVTEVPVITGASNIVVQLFEHRYGRQFDECCESHPLPRLKTFDFLTSASILCALSSVPEYFGGGLMVSSHDLTTFEYLDANRTAILQVVKKLKGKATTENTGSDIE